MQPPQCRPSPALQMLRAKCAEIIQEIAALKGQIEQGQKDNQAYGQLERKYETLTNEMRTLQGACQRAGGGARSSRSSRLAASRR